MNSLESAIQRDRRTRKVLAYNKCHHSGAAVERLYFTARRPLQTVQSVAYPSKPNPTHSSSKNSANRETNDKAGRKGHK